MVKPYGWNRRGNQLRHFGLKSIEITKETRKFLKYMFMRVCADQYVALSEEAKEAITTEIMMVAPTFTKSWWYHSDIWAVWAHDLT